MATAWKMVGRKLGMEGLHATFGAKPGWELQALFPGRTGGEGCNNGRHGIEYPELSSLVWAVCVIVVLLLFLAAATKLALYYHSRQNSRLDDGGDRAASSLVTGRHEQRMRRQQTTSELSNRVLEEQLQHRSDILILSGDDPVVDSKVQPAPQPMPYLVIMPGNETPTFLAFILDSPSSA
ncbi:hypothetical protein KP509_09G046700 [Ceratopteris richardii]|uniref:Uncharacterized protein n=1 Tax=Ceratopteris richardii TaxID=49495 RepID=A0A8T2U6L2_CERRI|nr:hypothetical protein KP509_09G046700 [Ceratopteris richardii]